MGLHGLPFNNEIGLVNVYGIPKPVYRVFEALHNAGNRRLSVTGNANAQEDNDYRTAEVLALADDDTVTLLPIITTLKSVKSMMSKWRSWSTVIIRESKKP